MEERVSSLLCFLKQILLVFVYHSLLFVLLVLSRLVLF